MEYVSIQIPAALYAKIYGLYQEESSTVILRSLNQLTNEEQEKTKVSETPKDGITGFIDGLFSSQNIWYWLYSS